jgi:hypothetical protein
MTKSEINRELDNLEYKMKHIRTNADNNGNFDLTEEQKGWYERHDELMEMLNTGNHK